MAIGLGAARISRTGWKAFPFLLAACIVWAISRVIMLMPNLIPADHPYYLPASEALGMLFLAWFAAEEENLSEQRPVQLVLTLLLALFNVLIINALMPLRYAFLPSWLYPAAVCLPVVCIFFLWAMRKSNPSHFLFQGFVFLGFYAYVASGLDLRQDVSVDNLTNRINSLALAFAFFSIAMHAGHELIMTESASLSIDKLKSYFSGYISLYVSYLKTKVNINKRTHIDTLTAIQNFSAFQISLNKAIQEADKNSASFALVFFDIDHFSSINDRVGFETGDRILTTLSAGILKAVEPQYAGRIGGDEFAIILHSGDIDYQQQIENISAALHHDLEAIDGKTKVDILAAYAVYPYDFFEQSGVFRRMRTMLTTSGARAAPIRVKCV
ncbi:MAG: GGDEF domain-containing protein [bacterium]